MSCRRAIFLAVWNPARMCFAGLPLPRASGQTTEFRWSPVVPVRLKPVALVAAWDGRGGPCLPLGHCHASQACSVPRVGCREVGCRLPPSTNKGWEASTTHQPPRHPVGGPTTSGSRHGSCDCLRLGWLVLERPSVHRPRHEKTPGLERETRLAWNESGIRRPKPIPKVIRSRDCVGFGSCQNYYLDLEEGCTVYWLEIPGRFGLGRNQPSDPFEFKVLEVVRTFDGVRLDL